GGRRRSGGAAEELPPNARERRVRDGVSGGRARDEQALPRALSPPALRAGLRPPRARGARADRARGDRRLRGAAAGPLEPAPTRARARDARLPDHADLPVAGPARPAAAAGEVPYLLRRAARARGRLERRGRGDRALRRPRARRDRGAARARPARWPRDLSLMRLRSAPAALPRGGLAALVPLGLGGLAALGLGGLAALGCHPGPPPTVVPATGLPAPGAGPPESLVLISISGLGPSDYRGEAPPMPTLAALARAG